MTRDTLLMQPFPPQGPFAIQYDVRGPEVAVVVPYGDHEALREVVRSLSQVWNGPGALLLPADPDGKLRAGLEDSIAARPPEHVLVHPLFGAEVQTSIGKRWGQRTGLWEPLAFRHEVHPFWLIRDDGTDPRIVREPVPLDDDHALLAGVLWGYIDPDDAGELPSPYLLIQVAPEGFHGALLSGQISGLSPLSWAARCMSATQSVNGPSQRALFVIEEGAGYDEMALFWNLRARYPTLGPERSIVAVTVEGLASDPFPEAILEWLHRPPHGVKPDLVVSVTEQNADRAREALLEAGLKLVEEAGWTIFSQLPEDRRALEFQLGPLEISQRLRRGRGNDSLINLREGVNPVRLPLPEGLPRNLGWTGFAHTEIRGLPLAFPITDELAGTCLTNAIASGNDAIAVTFGGEVSPIRTEITLPPYDSQLARHMASVRLRAELSPAGRIAQALLGRLAVRQELDPLAHPIATRVLGALIVPSRLKLAQRVRQELERTKVASVDEKQLVSLLRQEGLFLELQTRTLEQLASETSLSTREVLAPVAGLCEVGYLQRGRSLRCPRCEMPDFWRLRELDERLICRACRQEFPLPAAEGTSEVRTGYRLDGLVARALDQDLLGTLLVLRFLLERSVQAKSVAWWPGLELFELSSTSAEAEIDLLFAADGVLTICEVKADAAGVDDIAVTRLVDLADRIRARRVLAAPTGQWKTDVAELSAKHDVMLCGPSELLTDNEVAALSQS